MKIELPENPYLYTMILGILFIGFSFLFVILEGRKDLVDILLIIFGVIFGFFSYKGLEKTHNLKNKKLEEEIKLIKVKQEESQALARKYSRLELPK